MITISAIVGFIFFMQGFQKENSSIASNEALMKTNVEALADSVPSDKRIICANMIEASSSTYVFYCGTCSFIPGIPASNTAWGTCIAK